MNLRVLEQLSAPHAAATQILSTKAKEAGYSFSVCSWFNIPKSAVCPISSYAQSSGYHGNTLLLCARDKDLSTVGTVKARGVRFHVTSRHHSYEQCGLIPNEKDGRLWF